MSRLGKSLVLVTCLVVLLGIVGSTTAVAETVAKSIQAYFGVKIVAGGRTIITDKEPFIYNGSTYVPLRVVSEALGKAVSWDGENYQVIIADDPAKGIDHLGSLPPSDWKWRDGRANRRVKLNGTEMSPALYVRGYYSEPSYVTWALNGQYKTLEGVVGVPEKGSERAATITLSLDNKPAATIKLLTGTAPQPFKVDVSNALELRITITYHEGSGVYPDHAFVGTLTK